MDSQSIFQLLQSILDSKLWFNEDSNVQQKTEGSRDQRPNKNILSQFSKQIDSCPEGVILQLNNELTRVCSEIGVDSPDVLSLLFAVMSVLPNHLSVTPDVDLESYVNTIWKAVEVLLGLAMYPALDPGVGVPLSLRMSNSKTVLQMVPLQNLPSTKKEFLLNNCVNCLLGLTKVDALKTVVHARFLSDILMGVFQLIQDNKENASVRSELEKKLANLISNTSQIDLIQQLLLLQTGSPNAPAPTPNWLREQVGRLLSECLLADNGVRNLLRGMEAMGGENMMRGKWGAMTAFANILSRPPKRLSTDRNYYFENICTQINNLLSEEAFSASYPSLLYIIVSRLKTASKSQTERIIMDQIFRPLEYCSQPDIIPQEEHLGRSVRILSLLLNSVPPSEEFFSIPRLKAVSDILFSIFLPIRHSVSQFRKPTEDILVWLVQKFPTWFSIGLMTNWESTKDLVLHTNRNIEFAATEIGIKVSAKENSSELNFELTSQILIQLLKTVSQDIRGSRIQKIVGGCLRYILQLNSRLTKTSKPASIENMQSTSDPVLLRLEERDVEVMCLVNVTSFLSCVMETFEEEVVQNPAELVPLLQELIESCNSSSQKDGLMEQLGSIAVGIVGALLLTSTTAPETKKSFEKLLPLLQGLSMKFPDFELGQKADSLLSIVEEVFGIQSGRSDNHNQGKLKSNVDEKQEGKISEYKEALRNLSDPLIPIQTQGLVELSRLLRKKDPETLSQTEELYPALLEKVSSEDSYVFLAAINALSALAPHEASSLLPCLIHLFVSADKERRLSAAVRVKVGEVLVKTCQNLNELTPAHAHSLLPPLLALTSDADSAIRASSLSTLAELAKFLGFKLSQHIHELVYCAEQIVKNDQSETVRRAAVYLLRGIVSGSRVDMLEVLRDVIHRLYRLVKVLRTEDGDWVVRLQAELCCREIDANLSDACQDALPPLIQLL